VGENSNASCDRNNAGNGLRLQWIFEAEKIQENGRQEDSLQG
jgi:hypothetical protein